jgi:hypothetical protein
MQINYITSEVQDQSESNSDDLQLPEKQTTPKGPKQDPPGRLSGDFRINKLENIGGGEGKRKYPARQSKCVLHIRSKVKLGTFVNSSLFCLTKGLVLRNTIQ